MKIAFDYEIFTLQMYGGVSRYYSRLVEYLGDVGDTQAKILAPLHINRHIKQMPLSSVCGIGMPSFPKTVKARRYINEVLFPLMANKFKPDILHATHFADLRSIRSEAKQIITVYDMIYERFSQEFVDGHSYSTRKKIAADHADHILCISENTRRDLIEIFNVPEEKATAVLLGFDKLSLPTKEIFPRHASEHIQPFMLYVGQRKGYKNFAGMLRAYASSAWLHNNFRIVCFGAGAFSTSELSLMKELNIEESKIEQLGGSDETLAWCYQNASAFVYPSLYEGFGIPPLEAMALECPVICSNTSSIPEVVGDAGAYFDPDNIESIRASMEDVLQSSEKRDDLVKKGLVRCNIFSWKKCAIETADVYRSLLQ